MAKLALLIDANPRSLRGPSIRSRLREGSWRIKSEGVVDSNIVIYHSLIGTEFERYALTDGLILKGPAHCFIEVINAGNEKAISVFAHSE